MFRIVPPPAVGIVIGIRVVCATSFEYQGYRNRGVVEAAT
jgi:hypothetical protein